MKFDHIGIATNDINETIKKISKFMNIREQSEIVYDELQDASLCMLTLDNVQIELIQGAIVENILKKRQYLYHTCYSVDNIEEIKEKLVSEGALVISEVKPAILFNMRKVVFLMWDLGLIELVEGEQHGVN
ncbi:MAG: VOC family protein [Erysipelotrichales bacterium]|nr:VOC family protein [Erysipelotrichales bacterium]